MARVGTLPALILLAACDVVAAAPLYELDPACAHVLIDRSHEWLFAYDDLSEGILGPRGYQAVLSDAALNTRCKLADFDVVFVQQIATQVPFADDEIALLTEYVRGGGKLILVGRPDRPIARVVAAFGVHLREVAGVAPLMAAPSLVRDFGAEPRSEAQRVLFTLEAPPSAEVLVVEQQRAPVAVRIAHGGGEVIVFADDGCYWDFCARRRNGIGVHETRPGYSVPDMGLTAALFRLLTPQFRMTKKAPVGARVYGELSARSGPLAVVYSRPLIAFTGPMLEALPGVSRFVQAANGGLLPGDAFAVHLLAGSGGGWASGAEIGISCEGTAAGKLAVAAHEMTHCYEGAMAGVFCESWASLVGMRACVELGLSDSRTERAEWERLFRQADPTGCALDILRTETDPSLMVAAAGKAMWMIETLEARYGADFMRRFLEIRRALKPGAGVSATEVLHYFSLTAGQDLTDWYRALGISYQAPPPVAPDDLQQRLEAYRADLRQRLEDQRQLAAYEQAPTPFADDRWRDEWRVVATLVPDGDAWMDDPADPPACLRHVVVPNRGGRRGLLVGHAPAPDKPFRMERELEVPANGHPRLVLGLARRVGGGPSLMRLCVNDEPVWSRLLERDGWLHTPVDLTPFAGQRVMLALEADTRGEWGCREFLIDYLTVLAGD